MADERYTFDNDMGAFVINATNSEDFAEAIKEIVSKNWVGVKEPVIDEAELTKKNLEEKLDDFWEQIDQLQNMIFLIAGHCSKKHKYGDKKPPPEFYQIYTIASNSQTQEEVESELMYQIAEGKQKEERLRQIPEYHSARNDDWTVDEVDKFTWLLLWKQTHEINQAIFSVKESVSMDKKEDIPLSQLQRSLQLLSMVTRSTSNLCYALQKLREKSQGDDDTEFVEFAEDIQLKVRQINKIDQFLLSYSRVHPTVTLSERQHKKFDRDAQKLKKTEERLEMFTAGPLPVFENYNSDVFAARYGNCTLSRIQQLIDEYMTKPRYKKFPKDSFFKLARQWTTKNRDVALDFEDFLR